MNSLVLGLKDNLLIFITSMCWKEGLFTANTSSSELFSKLKSTENWGTFEYYKQNNWSLVVFELIYLSILLCCNKYKSLQVNQDLPQLVLQEIRSKQFGDEWITELSPNGNKFYRIISNRLDVYDTFDGTNMEEIIEQLFLLCSFTSRTKNSLLKYFVNKFERFYKII